MTGAGRGERVAGRYLLQERLGAGGMGTVWRALDEALDTEVALKQVRLPGGPDDLERIERARREARNAARLRDHPNVVATYDVVSHEGLPWIVMELVPSRSLADVIFADGPLDESEAARVGLAVLDALVHGHRRGIVHRDVKPSNILLVTPASDGDMVGAPVRLGDFGIASHESDTTITVAGTVGTLDYLAPERFDAGRAEPASDLYALGASVFEAIEGRAPFSRGTTQATMKAILTGQHWPFRQAEALAPLVTTLLATDPAGRPNAQEVRARLAEVAAPLSVTAATTGSITAADPTNPEESPRGASTRRVGTEPPALQPSAGGQATTSVVPTPRAAAGRDEPAAPEELGTPRRRRLSWSRPAAVVLSALALAVALAALAVGVADLTRGPEHASAAASAPRLSHEERALLRKISGETAHGCAPDRDQENAARPAVLRCQGAGEKERLEISQHVDADAARAAVASAQRLEEFGRCPGSRFWFDDGGALGLAAGAFVCESTSIFWTYDREAVSAVITGADGAALYRRWAHVSSRLLV
jgi:serine/threonine protein kinase